ncbi:Bcr/CflA family efflux MFS transporter [Ktedonosporobacter rubrisoli]|uniref:Bcr/CflA family efflux MFS transporter n=1 Tax=Ktedonosporobacter rubrisoli TaxID=2509675 RepID=A0A4P6K650_KTERU|nr:Bcr/CflA family efflux MFS transporter [Ktedonosporobacter rubrisoli]
MGAMMAIGPLSTDMYLPALPVLSHELGATMSQTQITLTATLLGMALGPLLIGPLSDARGRRGPLLIGMSCYVVLSLLCLIAHSIGLLIVLRFAQGFAASAGIVIALAIARDLYAGRALARCVSLLMMVNFLAPIVAPVLGGLLLSFTSWRGVFVSLALFGIALVLVVAFGLSETLPPARRQDGGFSASLAEFRFLLFNGRFVGCALSLGFTFTAIFVYIASSPFIFENIYGLSPQSTSLVFGVIALGIPITAQLNARLLTRISAQELLIWGASAIALGSIALIAAVITGVGLIGVLPSCFLIVTSVGLITPNATALALSKARAAGSASALLGVLQIGLAVVVAPLIGLAGSKSALPMAATIAGSGLATLLTVVVLSRSGKGN